VVGSETLSRIVDWKDRSTAILFGDGAGAVILEGSEETGILHSKLLLVFIHILSNLALTFLVPGLGLGFEL
jgi:hypothetical protein